MFPIFCPQKNLNDHHHTERTKEVKVGAFMKGGPLMEEYKWHWERIEQYHALR